MKGSKSKFMLLVSENKFFNDLSPVGNPISPSQTALNQPWTKSFQSPLFWSLCYQQLVDGFIQVYFITSFLICNCDLVIVIVVVLDIYIYKVVASVCLCVLA
jgi:hypothetical protein